MNQSGLDEKSSRFKK